MTLLVGIDLSTTKISIVELNPETEEYNIIELVSKKSDWLARCYELHDKFVDYVKSCQAGYFTIEEISYVVNKQSYYKLVTVLAMLRTVLYQNNKDYEVMHNSTWKRLAGIKTGAKRKEIKDRIKEHAIGIFGEEVKGLNQDTVDALLIAVAGNKQRKLDGGIE